MMKLATFVWGFLPFCLAVCPAGSVPGLASDNCLLFSTKPLPWQQAEQECASYGGHLASISDAVTNTFLETAAPTNCSHVYWTGGNIRPAAADGGGWTWSDAAAWSYANWPPAQPTSKATTCVVYDVRTGKWYSEMCASAKPFICKLPSATAAVTSTSMTSCARPSRLPTCDEGWTYFNGTGKCYKVLDGDGTWPIHESKCNLLGAHLASIHSVAENTFIRDLASTGKTMSACNETYCAAAVWIGLYRNCPTSHEFKWIDRSKFDYRAWGPSRPFLFVFFQHTYVSLYADQMAKPAGFYSKWDHYKQNSVTNVRAGVCKRDY